MEKTGSAILTDNMIISVGEAYLIANLLPEGAEDYGKSYHCLRLKIFGGTE